MSFAAAHRADRAESVRHWHPADAFVDSVGVNTHLDSLPYRRHRSVITARLAALGVRHVRDEVTADNDVAYWRSLAHAADVRFHLLASPVTNSTDVLIYLIASLGATAVSAVEGQNEGDSPWFQSQSAAGRDWAQTVNAYQRRLFAAIRRRFSADQIPVLSPTVLDYKPEDMALLTGSADYCDAVAVHAYPQDQQEPETTDDYAALPWYLQRFRDPFKPGARVMLTEAGYCGGADGVSNAAAAIYVPRLLLTAYALGIERSFLYELLDEGTDPANSEQNYGLLNAAGDAKPAYAALKALLGALSDPGPPLAPVPLRIDVEGTRAIRTVAFQKRDGTAIVAIWRADRVWDPERRRNLAGGSETVRLHLPPGFKSARFLPLRDGASWAAPARLESMIDCEVTSTVQLVSLSR